MALRSSYSGRSGEPMISMPQKPHELRRCAVTSRGSSRIQLWAESRYAIGKSPVSMSLGRYGRVRSLPTLKSLPATNFKRAACHIDTPRATEKCEIKGYYDTFCYIL